MFFSYKLYKGIMNLAVVAVVAVFVPFMGKNICSKAFRQGDKSAPCVYVEGDTAASRNKIYLFFGASDISRDCEVGINRGDKASGLVSVVVYDNNMVAFSTIFERGIYGSSAFFKNLTLEEVQGHEHEFYVQARDVAGNVAKSRMLRLVVDNNKKAAITGANRIQSYRAWQAIKPSLDLPDSLVTLPNECPADVMINLEKRNWPEVLVHYRVSGGMPDRVYLDFNGKRVRESRISKGVFYVNHKQGLVTYVVKAERKGCGIVASQEIKLTAENR